jgi:hypothetical protein
MIHLEFFGGHVGVRVDAELGQHIEALWSPFLRSRSDLPDDATVLDVSGGDFARSLSAFAVEVNAFALATCADLAVHAGVLDVGGSTMALPGTSGAGKSTLTAACVRAGMGYVSDEALCLPYETSGVRGYPRPIALSPWSMRALAIDTPPSSSFVAHDSFAMNEATEFMVAPSVLGKTCDTPGPLLHIVVPQRAVAGDPELTPLHRADVAALMLRLSFNHFRRPAAAFELMTATVRGAGVWQLRYSDPVAAARLLIDRFG